MYRSAVEEVPVGDFELPLGKADVISHGDDVTLIAWGTQVHVMSKYFIGMHLIFEFLPNINKKMSQ